MKPLQKQTVKDYDDCVLKVRCDGVPKPEVRWSVAGRDVTDDERHKVTTTVGGQVDSELEIKHFNVSDAGKVTELLPCFLYTFKFNHVLARIVFL